MDGASMRSTMMLKRLCGEDAFPSVILGTTFWDRVNQTVGDQRMNELVTNSDFWGEMVRRGSSVEKLTRDYTVCQRLLLKMASQRKKSLQIQEEMVVQGKDVAQTSAGTFVDGEMANFRSEQTAKLAEANREGKMKLAQKEIELREIWERERLNGVSILQDYERQIRITRERELEEQRKKQESRLRRQEAEIRQERSGYEAKKVYAQMMRIKRKYQLGVIPCNLGTKSVRWCDCCLEIFGDKPFFGTYATSKVLLGCFLSPSQKPYPGRITNRGVSMRRL